MKKFLKDISLIAIYDYPNNNKISFDCGRNDLNQFLIEEAISFQNELLGFSYLGVKTETQEIIFYYTLQNDRITKKNLSYHVASSKWKKFQHISPITNFPALKIGRLAVSLSSQDKKIGSKIIDYIKQKALTNRSLGGCRFITVDSDPRQPVINFYIKNSFIPLISSDKIENFIQNNKKVPMFFDLKNL